MCTPEFVEVCASTYVKKELSNPVGKDTIYIYTPKDVKFNLI